MYYELILICLGFVLCIVAIYHKKDQKKIKELNYLIDVYDKSDKVIKNCIVYTPEEAVTINCSNTATIDCRFEQLQHTPATKMLNDLLGIKQNHKKSK